MAGVDDKNLRRHLERMKKIDVNHVCVLVVMTD